MPDTIGKALGFALAVYDQTSSAGGQLDRINETRATLSDMLENERFSDDVAAVLDGLCAGLTSYMQFDRAKQTGCDTDCKVADVDGVYVLQANGQLFIKRVTRRLDGVHEISSDNPTVRTVDVLNGSQPVRICGRVVYGWNGRRF